MKSPNNLHFANNGSKYFAKLCHVLFLAGFPNMWIEELEYSKGFLKIYGFFSKVLNAILYMLMVSEWAAPFTQHNLTEKQKSDSLLFIYSHPILFSYRLIITYHEKKIKQLVLNLTVKLKEVYNDEKVERKMIRKSKVCSVAFSVICSLSLVLYGFNSLMLSLKTGRLKKLNGFRS